MFCKVTNFAMLQFIALLLILCSGATCSKQTKPGQGAGGVAVERQRLDICDSNLLCYSLRALVVENWRGVHQLNSESERQQMQVFTDTILYSPDYLKMFAIMLTRVRCGIKYDGSTLPPDSMCYDGYGMVGFRSSKRSVWNVYLFDHFQYANGESYQMTAQAVKRYFFSQMKEDGHYVHHTSGKNIIVKYLYNVDDPMFWEGSSMWMRGGLIEGYYDFQVPFNEPPTGNYTSNIYPLPDYPDSLVQCYH